MTLSDINRVIAQFVTCARVLAQCGFSGIEIHAAHGYLLCESSFSDIGRLIGLCHLSELVI